MDPCPTGPDHGEFVPISLAFIPKLLTPTKHVFIRYIARIPVGLQSLWSYLPVNEKYPLLISYRHICSLQQTPIFDELRKVAVNGFSNEINQLELMAYPLENNPRKKPRINIVETTTKHWKRSVRHSFKFRTRTNPDHLSTYPLTLRFEEVRVVFITINRTRQKWRSLVITNWTIGIKTIFILYSDQEFIGENASYTLGTKSNLQKPRWPPVYDIQMHPNEIRTKRISQQDLYTITQSPHILHWGIYISTFMIYRFN